MTYEEGLTAAVRSWVEGTLPGDTAVADCAVGTARAAYRSGATVGESCELARSLVDSWVRHPAYSGRLAAARPLHLAS